MKIFPAIDIKDEKCVRLVKGDFNKKIEYEMSPIEQAGRRQLASNASSGSAPVKTDAASIVLPCSAPSMMAFKCRMGK